LIVYYYINRLNNVRRKSVRSIHQYHKAEARLNDRLPILFNEVAVGIDKYLVYNNASIRACVFYCVNGQT